MQFEKGKFHDTAVNCGFVILMLYASFMSVIQQVLNRKIQYLILAIALLMCFWGLIKSKNLLNYKKIDVQTVLWVCFFLLFLFGNADLKACNYIQFIRGFVCFQILFLLQNQICWVKYYPSVMKAVLAVHIVATYLFLVLPPYVYSEYALSMFGFFPVGTNEGTMGYTAALNGHYSTNGTLIVLAVFVAFSYLLADQKENKKKDMILFTVSFIALLLTTKRAHLLFGTFAMLVVYVLVNWKKKARGTVIKCIQILAIGMILVLIASLFIPEIQNVFARIRTLGSDSESTTRLRMWQVAFEMFRAAPIFGWGWGEYKWHFVVWGAGKLNAHNVYIQLLAERGIIGLIVFVAIAGYSLISIFRILYRHEEINLTRIQYNVLLLSGTIQLFVILYCLTGNCLYDFLFFFYTASMAAGYVVQRNVYNGLGTDVKDGGDLEKSNKNMKLGILTFQAALNYGAELQAYALKSYVSEQGYSVDVINYVPEMFCSQYDIKPFGLKSGILNRFRAMKYYLKIKNQYCKFKAFRTEYLELGNVLSEKSFKADNLPYDIIIYGSDQIWNLNITGSDYNYWGANVQKSTVKVAYAASLGNSAGRLSFSELSYLEDFCSIAVREKDAAQTLAEMLKQPVDYVVDPVFLKDRFFWEEIQAVPKVRGKYALCYTLEPNNQLCKRAVQLCNEERIFLYSIHGKLLRIMEEGKFLQNVGPLEFLGLIANAEYVVTSSFHALAFSIIFEKKVILGTHSETGSRVASLMELMGISSIDSGTIYDFSRMDRTGLDKVIELSKEYLINVIEGTER